MTYTSDVTYVDDVTYSFSLPISPRLIWVCKAFLMGLSAGGLICGGGGDGLCVDQNRRQVRRQTT